MHPSKKGAKVEAASRPYGVSSVVSPPGEVQSGNDRARRDLDGTPFTMPNSAPNFAPKGEWRTNGLWCRVDHSANWSPRHSDGG